VITPGQWNHVTGVVQILDHNQQIALWGYSCGGTRPAALGKIYVNGVEVAYGHQWQGCNTLWGGSGPTSGNSILQVGDQNGRGDSSGYAGWTYFNGVIDAVRFYNRVLSDSEIQLLYSAGQ